MFTTSKQLTRYERAKKIRNLKDLLNNAIILIYGIAFLLVMTLLFYIVLQAYSLGII